MICLSLFIFSKIWTSIYLFLFWHLFLVFLCCIYCCFECCYEIHFHFLCIYLNIFKNIFWYCLFTKLKMDPTLIYIYLKMFSNGPPPIPIPGVSKRLLSGGKTIRKQIIVGDFLWSLWKTLKQNPYQGAWKGVRS